MGGADVKMLTISENIELNMDYYKMIQIFHKRDVRDRFMIKADMDKLTQADIEQKIEKLVTIIEKKRARQAKKEAKRQAFRERLMSRGKDNQRPQTNSIEDDTDDSDLDVGIET